MTEHVSRLSSKELVRAFEQAIVRDERILNDSATDTGQSIAGAYRDEILRRLGIHAP